MSDIPNIDESEYKIIKILGKGAFGEVKLAENKEGKKVAIKYILKKMDDEQLQKLRDEVNILKELSTAPNCHPGIVCYHGLFKLGEKFVLIMDYLEGYDLDNWTDCQRKANYILSKEEFLRLAIHLSETIAYMHSFGITHRDIKPANIIFTENRLVLVDFGIACYYKNYRGKIPECNYIGGTPLYMAPEVYKRSELLGRQDVWSLGCVLYDLVTLTDGIYTVFVEKFAKMTRKPQEKFGMPRCTVPTVEIGNIITSCFNSNPHARPNAGEISKYLKNPENAALLRIPENVKNNYDNIEPLEMKGSVFLTRMKEVKFVMFPENQPMRIGIEKITYETLFNFNQVTYDDFKQDPSEFSNNIISNGRLHTTFPKFEENSMYYLISSDKYRYTAIAVSESVLQICKF